MMAMPTKKEEELYDSQVPAMRQVDHTALVFFIAYSIGDYLAFVGLDSAMTEKQTNDTAMMIAEVHPNLPIDALKLFFYNCKRGVYGKHYNRMDGSTLLQWFDTFCDEFFVNREEADYQRHLMYKQEGTEPAKFTGEEGVPIDYNELLASFHGKTKEELEREKKIVEIRLSVQSKNIHLYDSLPVEEADKRIENAIIEEMKAQGLLTF